MSDGTSAAVKAPALNDLGEVHLCAEVYATHQDKVLMHRRSETKNRFPGYLIGPGGHVDEGEDIVVAAAREVKEETGIIVPLSSLRLRVVSIHHHLDTHTIWVCWIYRADLDTVQGNLQSSDEGTSEWISLEGLMREAKVFPPSREYFEHVLNDDTGMLYTNSEWSANQLVRNLSRTVVR